VYGSQSSNALAEAAAAAVAAAWAPYVKPVYSHPPARAPIEFQQIDLVAPPNPYKAGFYETPAYEICHVAAGPRAGEDKRRLHDLGPYNPYEAASFPGGEAVLQDLTAHYEAALPTLHEFVGAPSALLPAGADGPFTATPLSAPHVGLGANGPVLLHY